jgi:hypothetical protein
MNEKELQAMRVLYGPKVRRWLTDNPKLVPQFLSMMRDLAKLLTKPNAMQLMKFLK